MTEATNQLLTRKLADLGLRDLQGAFDFRRAVRWYDTFANMGPQVLGGVDWSNYYADWWAGAESYTALFTMLAFSQVAGQVWDWPQYQAFRSFNSALYTYPASEVVIPESDVFMLMGQNLAGAVDGQPVDAWLAAQPIAARPEQQGRHLGVYASRFTLEHQTPVNPNQVVFFAFAWGPDPTYPIQPAQLRVEDGSEGKIRIFDLENVEVFAGTGPLRTKEPTYPNGNSLALPDTSAWTRGAYRIEAEAEVDGEALTAANYFLAGVPELLDAEDGLGVISLDKQGQISDGTWESPDCTITAQERGALLLEPPQLDTLPASCTLISVVDPGIQHVISVPLPATRVITVVGPGQPMITDQGIPSDHGTDAGAAPVLPADAGALDPEPQDQADGCRLGPGSPRSTRTVLWILLLVLVLRRRH